MRLTQIRSWSFKECVNRWRGCEVRRKEGWGEFVTLRMMFQIIIEVEVKACRGREEKGM